MQKESFTLTVSQLVSIGLIFGSVSLAWIILGGTLKERHARSASKAHKQVSEHWGPGHSQQHPQTWYVSGPTKDLRNQLRPISGHVDVKLAFQPTKKGLTYNRTYKADVHAVYQISNHTDTQREIFISFSLPSKQSSYTGFVWKLDGQVDTSSIPRNGKIQKSVILNAGKTVPLEIRYTSRGMNYWEYQLGNAERIQNFQLTMETDFDQIDFLEGSGSPTSRSAQTSTDGWQLVWDYPDVIRPQNIGMDMPTVKNPAPIAAKISFFAPIPLLFFFTILIIFGLLKGISLHPMHFVFLAGCFFSFHLLFAYMVDLLPLHLSFAIASIVSITLVGTYVKAIGGKRLMKIALPAQLIYLILFSYSFLFHGMTGLTLAIVSIATLALIMHATAKVDWNQIFTRKKSPATQNPATSATT